MMATLQLVLLIALGSQFCGAQQQGVCYESVSQLRSYSSYVTRSFVTYYQCWWSRCSRTRYYQHYVIRHQTVYVSQLVCCAGYKKCVTDCCPICNSMCQSWEVCTAPNTCSCPPGFTGDNCTEPLCNNCDSNHTCIAAHTCVCPTGLTGNDCHIDINECEANVAGCEHSCNNFHRGYNCTCEDGYALSRDGHSCLGAPQNISFTALNSTTLLLHWEPPEEDPRDGMILQYSIVCRFGDGDSLPPRNSPASSQSLQLTDLRPFTNYNCCVSAQRTNGNSPESCSSETTPEDVPEDFPSNLALTNISSYAVLIEWSPPNIPNGVITAYTIYIDYNNDILEPERIVVMNGSTSHFILKDLLPFQLVTVEMTANTSVGEGPKSGPIQVRTNPTAPSTAPLGVTVDTQSSSFSWSPPPLIDRNGIITKYTVTITEVESGERVQQFDVNSTVTSVALRDLIQIPCYTYRFSVAAYTVEYGPTATFDITPTARNSTTLLCFRLVNEEVETEDISIKLSQMISTQVFLNMTLDGHIHDIIFTNISTSNGDGSERVVMVFLQFSSGTPSRGIEEALSCWVAETSSIDIGGTSLLLVDPPTCLSQYEHTECLQLQSSNEDCGNSEQNTSSTHDRDVILSIVGGVVGGLILLFLIVGIMALVTRTKRKHKQACIPPVEPEHLCNNPLYGDNTIRYVDNPSYETLTTLRQPETERGDEAEYVYADPKSSHLCEVVSIPFTAPSEAETNHNEESGQEPRYAKLKLTDAVYKNVGRSDSEITQEDFYSHLDHCTGNLS